MVDIDSLIVDANDEDLSDEIESIRKRGNITVSYRGALCDYSKFIVLVSPTRYPRWYVDYCQKNNQYYDKNCIIER